MTQAQVFQSLKHKLQNKISDRQIMQWTQIFYEDCIACRDRLCPDLHEVAQRLDKGEPIQYIVNNARFYDLDFYVDKYVLIPRPETEELVFLIDEFLVEDTLNAIDLGTGCGCIPLLLKKLNPEWNLMACDLSEEAVRIAGMNSRKLGLDVHFFTADILRLESHPEIENQKFHLIVSNPPYIPRKEEQILEPSVKDNEPHLALFVEDENPVIFYEAVAQMGAHSLHNRGHIFCEIHPGYAEAVKRVFMDTGTYAEVDILEDMQGKKRFLHACKKR